MKNIQHQQIAIIGGGPGGLTLARLLQMNGAAVKVYERDPNRQARVQGATLDLHDESGLLALKEAGLTAAFEANYRPGADHVRVIDKHAHIVWDDTADKELDFSRPEIDRGPLREILLDSLQENTVVWNSQFMSLLPEGKGWQLQFRDGTTVRADIVIAADGANSRIRPYITPVRPFYSGITIVEGTVYNAAEACPEIAALLKGGKIFAMGDEKSLIVSSKGDGSMVFYTGCKTAEDWCINNSIDYSDRVQVLQWFRETFNYWDPVCSSLLKEAQLPLTVRPQYCMPQNREWPALPNLTMLGDAAHLMPPYAGEGVNMAMLDALELSKRLCDDQFPDLQAAIAAYEQEMRQRCAAVADMTMQSTAGLHGPDGIAYLLNIFR